MSLNISYKKSIVVFLVLLYVGQCSAQINTQKPALLQSDLKEAIQKVYGSAVSIVEYDTVSKKKNSGVFSGVAVSADGYILTAAHATTPLKNYKVTFPDGNSYIAVALGKIPSLDAAVIKINQQGSWPFANIGNSSSLNTNQTCISIAYPGSLNQVLPTVRSGYIAEPLAKNGFLRSTCLMEPGDSGGPLFDLNGNVIGIHSKIELSLDHNFEVRTAVFLKYWNALMVPKTYIELPDSNKIPPFFSELNGSTIQNMKAAVPQTSTINTSIRNVSFRIRSTLAGNEQFILGTLFFVKKQNYLVSKSSMVAEKPRVELGNGKMGDLTVISRDEANDLVLLRINTIVKGGMDVESIVDVEIKVNTLGQILFSPIPLTDTKVGILSNLKLDIPNRENSGYMGINVGAKGGRVIITQIQKNSPARMAKLEIGDQLAEINGLKIENSAAYIAEIKKFKPNDSILIQVNRRAEKFTKVIVLKSADEINNHIANRFTDGKSERRFGLKDVFAHDSRIKPSECGGPILDSSANFYCITIARFSRTTALAIPASTIKRFIKTSLATQL